MLNYIVKQRMANALISIVNMYNLVRVVLLLNVTANVYNGLKDFVIMAREIVHTFPSVEDACDEKYEIAIRLLRINDDTSVCEHTDSGEKQTAIKKYEAEHEKGYYETSASNGQ